MHHSPSLTGWDDTFMQDGLPATSTHVAVCRGQRPLEFAVWRLFPSCVCHVKKMDHSCKRTYSTWLDKVGRRRSAERLEKNLSRRGQGRRTHKKLLPAHNKVLLLFLSFTLGLESWRGKRRMHINKNS